MSAWCATLLSTTLIYSANFRRLPTFRKRHDGDPDPISAGTAGEAARWGGSSAAVGMAANPFGAHQLADRLALERCAGLLAGRRTTYNQ